MCFLLYKFIVERSRNNQQRCSVGWRWSLSEVEAKPNLERSETKPWAKRNQILAYTHHSPLTTHGSTCLTHPRATAHQPPLT